MQNYATLPPPAFVLNIIGFNTYFLCIHFRYILAIDSKAELEEYLSELLDTSNPRHRRFIDELIKKWRQPERRVDAPGNLQVDYKNFLTYYIYVSPGIN